MGITTSDKYCPKKMQLSGFNLILIILLGFLVMFILYPLLSLVYNVANTKFVESLLKQDLIKSLLLSLTTATISTSILCIFGIPLAYVLARFHFRLKFMIRILIIGPTRSSPINQWHNTTECIRTIFIYRKTSYSRLNSISVRYYYCSNLCRFPVHYSLKSGGI